MLQEWEKKDRLEKYMKQKKKEKGKGKAEKNVDRRSEEDIHMKQEEKNVRTQRKCVKIEKRGNNCGGGTHETQLRTNLHLTIT